MKKPRSTQVEMQRRREYVLSKLEDGPKSIHAIFAGTDWTYAQAITVLRSMRSEGEIVQIGKNGREVLFSKTDGDNFAYLPALKIAKIIEHINSGENVNIVGMHINNNECKLDLQLESGEKLMAQVVA